MINQPDVSTRMRQLALVAMAAGVMVAVSLVVLQLRVFAGNFRASGAGGCGTFIEAIRQAQDDDVIVQMASPKDSDGAVITKDIRISGGWLPTVNCAENNQVFTNTLDYLSYGFVYSRSLLSELNNSDGPVLTIEDPTASNFPNIKALVVENIRFDSSGTISSGGGINGVISGSSVVRLENNQFIDNDVNHFGGGLNLEVRGGSHLIIIDSEFEDNSAGNKGGGLLLDIREGSRLTIESSQFLNNRGGDGAGFDIQVDDSSEVIIKNVSASQNQSTTSGKHGGGGRIVMKGGEVSIINSAFLSNTITGNGGGLYIEMDGGEVLIENTNFQNNSATSGGGLYVESVGTSQAVVTMRNTTFSNNTPNPFQAVQSGTGQLRLINLDKLLYLPTVLRNPSHDTEYARITNIALDDQFRYVIDFETNFSPNTADIHVHFFFDTVEPANAGVPGSGPWKLYGGPSPFTGYSFADRPFGPTGAETICILVANADHSIRLDTGNCMDLP